MQASSVPWPRSSLRETAKLGGRTLQGFTPHTAGPRLPPFWLYTAGHPPHAAGPGVTAAVSVPRCGQVRPISAIASWAGLNGPEAKTSRSRQISNPV